MKKCNLFCLAAMLIFVSGLFCKGFLCEPNEAKAKMEKVSQRVQKSVIIKLQKIEKEIFGGHEDGVRKN